MVITACTIVHYYNDRQYCRTETVLLIFPFLQTNITSQMWLRRSCHVWPHWTSRRKLSESRISLHTNAPVVLLIWRKCVAWSYLRCDWSYDSAQSWWHHEYDCAAQDSHSRPPPCRSALHNHPPDMTKFSTNNDYRLKSHGDCSTSLLDSHVPPSATSIIW